MFNFETYYTGLKSRKKKYFYMQKNGVLQVEY